MRDWLRARTALQAAIVGALLFLAASPMAGQQVPADRMFPAYRAPRFPGTNTPDLNGIWETLSTANWDILTHEAIAGPHPELMGAYSAGPPGLGIVEGNELPYRPEALEKKKKNFEPDDRRRRAPRVRDGGDAADRRTRAHAGCRGRRA